MTKLTQGILISLTEEEFNDIFTYYKKADGRFAWWETEKFPKRLDISKDFRLYVAVKGKAKGFFMVHEIYNRPNEEMHGFVYYPESWKPIKKGEKVRPRKGWRYYPKA